MNNDDPVRLARFQLYGGPPVNAVARHCGVKWFICFELDDGITIPSSAVEFDSLDEAREAFRHAWCDVTLRMR